MCCNFLDAPAKMTNACTVAPGVVASIRTDDHARIAETEFAVAIRYTVLAIALCVHHTSTHSIGTVQTRVVLAGPGPFIGSGDVRLGRIA
jgi:hypothetical protein